MKPKEHGVLESFGFDRRKETHKDSEDIRGRLARLELRELLLEHLRSCEYLRGRSYTSGIQS